MSLVLSFFLWASLPADARSLEYRRSATLVRFMKSVNQCLDKKSPRCLEKFIIKENLNFPEHMEFGCQTERPGHINQREFAACVFRSKVKFSGEINPKNERHTLGEVFRQCFKSPRAVHTDRQIVVPSGYTCQLEDVRGELFITSVAVHE